MSRQVAGEGGSGSVTVYTFAAGETAMVESLSFTVATDGTAGTHAIRVKLDIPTVGVVLRGDDLNIGGPGQTNFYTYALGLNASACTLPDGLAATDALPWTELPPGSTVTVEAINATGVEIAGDAISNVLLQLSDAAAAPPPASTVPITLLPGNPAALAA